MEAFFFMAFIVLAWAWAWPGSAGRWLRDVEAGYRQVEGK